MNDFVVLFPAHGTSRADFEAAVRQHLACPEIIDIPPAVPSEKINDADQLPLWCWFVGS